MSEDDELRECHQTFRTATDQTLKSIAFLAATNAVLLSVALEQQRALAIAASAVIPIIASGLLIYLGAQFGIAMGRGAILEYRSCGRPDGFFWMLLRGTVSGYAEQLSERLSRGDDLTDLPAPRFRPRLMGVVLPIIAALELLAMVLAVRVLDWSWA